MDRVKGKMVLACGSGRCGEIIAYTIIIKRFLFLLSRPGITKTVKSHIHAYRTPELRTIQKLFFTYIHITFYFFPII